MKKSFRILLTLVLVLVTLLSLTACISDCDAGMHAFVEIPAKEATCTEAGNVAYKKCPVCGVCIDADGKQIAEADVVIPATGHVFDQEVATATYLASEATCTAKATYYKSCACGAKGTETFESGNLAAHTYGTVSYVWATDNSTCTATRTCSRDASHVETETVNSVPTVTQQATCTLPELTKYVATFENSAFADQTKADVETKGTLGHDIEGVTLSHDDENHYYICKREGCNDHVNTTAHDYNKQVTEGYKATEATCTAKATYYKSCACGAQGTETFESSNLAEHAYTQEVATENYLKSAATCTAKAVYYKSCACGAKGTETFESGNLAAHTYGTWIDEVPATCVAAGTKGYYTCSVCEKNYDKDDNEIDDLTLAIDEDAHDCKYEDTSSTKHTVSCQREGCAYTAAVEHSYTNGVCVCRKTEPKVGWKGVNDVSELKVGDKIIIVGAKGDALYAIGTNQKTNNRAAVKITKNGAVITIGDDVQVIVLEEGTKEGTFAFSVGNGYLYAASSAKNNMKTETTLSDNSSWTIAFANGAATITAQGTNTRNMLRFNSNNTLFSCYSSGQTEVYIYKYYSACDHEGKDTDTTTTAATCTTDGATVVTCKYCGEAISTTVLPAGHVYGEPVANATDSSVHTYTCTREGCEHFYNEAHAYENHVCTKCNVAEPTYTITVSNTAVDGNSATVVVKVGENVISIGADGNYTVYQNSEVTIIITAPEGYMIDAVKKGETKIEDFNGLHTFTITDDVTFEVIIAKIPEAHTCDFKTPAPLDSTDEQYSTHHKMTCSCGKASETLVAHDLKTVEIEGNDTAHNRVCVCGYTVTENHSYDATTHKCICEKFDPSVVTTIADALTASEGQLAMFSGTVVEIKEAWNTQYGNMSVWVSDGTDRILVYRTTTQVVVGDKVTVNGEIGVYSNANQIAAGDTITVDEKHTCTDFTTADCTHASVCTVCGAEHSPALGHTDEDGDGKCDSCGGDMNAKSWKLVTDASTLQAGDTIIIVAEDSNYALSTTQNPNNRGQAAVTKSNDAINTVGDDVQQITIQAGKIDGTLAFYTGSGYLYAASDSKNYLKTDSTLSDNSSWSITITEDGTATIQAQGTNKRNLLKYNNSSKIFSCYASGQEDVVIYKLG